MTFKDMHPADIAEAITEMKRTDRNLAFLKLSPDLKVEVFSFLDINIQEEIVRSMTREDYADVLNNLEPDDRTELLEDFPDELIKYSINLLNDKEKQIALNLIGYKEDSIARLMTPLYIQTKANKTVRQVLDHIKVYGKKAETLNYIYVVDDHNRLIDDLKLGELVLADENTLIADLIDNTFASITSTTKTEDAFDIFEKYDRSALPIITESGVLVGIVTFDDILDAIKDRDTEDIQKFGGMEELDLSYTHTPLFELVRKRAGWLIILFLGEMLTASAMGHFEDEIEKAVVLALFVPLIISSGGNSGSQAASLIIRAMALGELKLSDWWYVMRKEVASGVMLGGILGIIGFVRIFIWQEAGIYDYGEHWIAIGLSVSVSLLFIVLWGTLSGSLIPFILRKFGMDPATASAPFVATLVDVSGLIIYFSIAAMFLSGKIL
ncbi:magnesium transporter [Myroides odoratimimus]|uniref:Magnesium transporter MgtE n=3 Tax=Myroides odoratimimus TaxID=76832 RepID=A0A0S7E8G2_9FLAO|nr:MULTISPECIES: magnesium transporter [Myroides]AJA69262.1 Mg2+ transporter (mgtE) [Myroides sp. A21]ALU26488.1 magnesium transporter [Myroides odoratimimus]APA92545.1 magnesium transporter [Myroides sp. ZB35]EHO12022.1 magnesium transporter [Myroides odoratimimus CCUG 10230]EHO13202.1 magnesium transporter [Myroides odoratimimus CCUG 12901]